MLKDKNDLIEYIKENFSEVTDSRVNDDHFDIYCTHCGVVRGFQVTKRHYTNEATLYRQYDDRDFDAPRTIYFHCPVCDAHKIWIVFSIYETEKNNEGQDVSITKLFKVISIPGEGMEDIDELPNNPKSLKIAYRQAIRAMNANAYIAAAAMFRRALQIITRDILYAKPGKLADELRLLVGKEYNGAKITDDFANNGYIVKESGNQASHPDSDPDLLDFSEQDARDLRDIFLELVSELFVLPEAKRRAKQDFLNRRKIAVK